MENLWKNIAVFLFLIALIFGISRFIGSDNPSPQVAPVKEQVAAKQMQNQPTVLELAVPERIVIEADSVIIAGSSETGALVKVDGETVPLTESGTFSITLSPITTGSHSVQVTATAKGKQQTSKSVIVERKFTELQFDITGEYLGKGEVKVYAQTNLPEGTEVDLHLLSISKVRDDEVFSGIDFSRWYALYLPSAKNKPLGGFTFDDFNNPLVVSRNGSIKANVLIFHPEALRHNFDEMNRIHKTSGDYSLVISLEARKALEHDGKFIVYFRFSGTAFESVVDFDDKDNIEIPLPPYCKPIASGSGNDNLTEIQCTKTVSAKDIITADKLNGEGEQRAEAAAKEARECSILTDRDCYFYLHRSGNVTWQDAYSGCFQRDAELPSKKQVAAIRNELAAAYTAYPKLTFVWTKEHQTGDYAGIAYGWVESFKKNPLGEYRSDWATANSDKRDYVTYVCVRKR